jgi:carbamoyl-phosphate synthase large subunit
LINANFKILATSETYKFLTNADIKLELLDSQSIINTLKKDNINLVINTPTKGKIPNRDGYLLRRTAIEYNIACVTSLDTAKALISVIESYQNDQSFNIYDLHDYSKEEH